MQDYTRSSSSIPGLDEETKQISFQILGEYPPLVRVFCHALDVNNHSYPGVGHIDIQVQGVLGSQ